MRVGVVGATGQVGGVMRRMLAERYGDRKVSTALALVEADEGERAAIAATVRTQLRLINTGSRHWQADR